MTDELERIRGPGSPVAAYIAKTLEGLDHIQNEFLFNLTSPRELTNG
jgi:hypothetical protein